MDLDSNISDNNTGQGVDSEWTGQLPIITPEPQKDTEMTEDRKKREYNKSNRGDSEIREGNDIATSKEEMRTDPPPLSPKRNKKLKLGRETSVTRDRTRSKTRHKTPPPKNITTRDGWNTLTPSVLHLQISNPKHKRHCIKHTYQDARGLPTATRRVLRITARSKTQNY